MHKFLPRVTYCCFCIILIGSCQDTYNICDKARDVSLKAGFYHITAGTVNSVTVPSLSLSIYDTSIVYYNQVPNLSSFSIALNPSLDSSRYSIRLSNTSVADTLTVVYTSEAVNLSPECGIIYINNLLRTYSTHHTIDSVQIINPVNNTTSGENIKIYF